MGVVDVGAGDQKLLRFARCVAPFERRTHPQPGTRIVVRNISTLNEVCMEMGMRKCCEMKLPECAREVQWCCQPESELVRVNLCDDAVTITTIKTITTRRLVNIV